MSSSTVVHAPLAPTKLISELQDNETSQYIKNALLKSPGVRTAEHKNFFVDTGTIFKEKSTLQLMADFYSNDPEQDQWSSSDGLLPRIQRAIYYILTDEVDLGFTLLGETFEPNTVKTNFGDYYARIDEIRLETAVDNPRHKEAMLRIATVAQVKPCQMHFQLMQLFYALTCPHCCYAHVTTPLNILWGWYNEFCAIKRTLPDSTPEPEIIAKMTGTAYHLAYFNLVYCREGTPPDEDNAEWFERSYLRRNYLQLPDLKRAYYVVSANDTCPLSKTKCLTQGYWRYNPNTRAASVHPFDKVSSGLTLKMPPLVVDLHLKHSVDILLKAAQQVNSKKRPRLAIDTTTQSETQAKRGRSFPWCA